MKFLRELKESYPIFYKVLCALVIIFLAYKLGYIFGKFMANVNF